MKQIKIILKKIGLTDTEAELYLVGLQYPCVGVGELEKQTRIKRTTIYHAINTLMSKGLVAKKETGGRMVFSMTRPENIKRLIDKEITLLQNQQQDLDEIIPLLKQHSPLSESPFKISHYEGLEGVKLVVEEALYCKSRHWDIIAPLKNFFSEFDKKYATYYLETRKSRGITARSLWEKDLPIRKLNIEDMKQRNPRYLPKNMHGRFKSVIIIFDDKVAIISSLKELSAILIQSSEVHDTMLAMFDGLWEVSIEYKKTTKP